MRITIFIIALLVGGWMVFDGLHSVLLGKYFGPDKPGPWTAVISALGFDPARFGLVFVAFGIDWIVGGIGVIKNRRWGYYLTGIMAALSLWYLAIGTVLSAVVLILIVITVTRKTRAS